MATDSLFNQMFYDLKEVKKLIDEVLKSYPENEPHKSNYAAKEILHTMLNNYKNISQDLPENLKIRGMVVHGTALLYLGTIGVDTEELSEGEKFLLSCVELLAPNQYLPEAVILLMNAYNQLGFLWCKRDCFSKSKSYLVKAAILYKEYLELNITPVEFLEVLKPPEEIVVSQAAENFEKAYTLTLYFLAQLYASDDTLRSAIYCHTTLKRQLMFGDFDPIEWALNAATLSQVFIEKGGFKQARHHLAAATYTVEKCSVELNEENDSSDCGLAKKEHLKHRYADVGRCWTKYCIELLSTSKERLMDDTDKSIPNSLSSEFEKLKIEEEGQVPVLDYDNLILDHIPLKDLENQVTDQFILTFEDARVVFLYCQKWIDFSKEYYTLDGHASDYVKVIQDRSSLYRHLAFYEEDEKRQCAMHKRRIDMLKDLVGELNPEYYGDCCRQMWFEVGETYSDILDIKLDKLKAVSPTERPTPQMLGKINYLVENSIKSFTCFVDSVKEKATNEFPKKMRIELLKPLLLVFFQLGRLNNKYIVLDKKVQLKNIEESLSWYNKFVEYCEADEVALKTMSIEFQVCQEMISLLPFKILKLQKEIKGP